jgi:anti-sigma factor RsiW
MHLDELTIGDYVDDALASGERAAVEQHLEQCDECRTLAADLSRVRRAAAALPPMNPPPHAWSGIERQIAAKPRNTPIGLRASAWWLAAAAVIVVAALVELNTSRSPRQAPGSAAPEPAVTVESIAEDLLQAEQHYQRAISGLEQIANAEQSTLDPEVAATLRKNLAIVDQAIGESRAALKAQPTSEPARQSLFESLKTKISLLQDTVALINEMRKGNEAGAARIVSGLQKKGG